MSRKSGVELDVRYACWGLLPSHVQKLRPHWSEEQAIDFLFESQALIAGEMARLGWLVLADALDQYKQGEH